MSEAVRHRSAAETLAAAHAALDAVHAIDLTALSEQELLEHARELERLRRRLPAVDHSVMREIAARGLPEAHHVRGLGQFLRMLLRLDPHEAAARVAAAEDLSRRRSLAGEVLPARFEAVATAQEAGAIGERHAALIVKTLHRLPPAVRDAQGAQLEEELVGYAHRFDPHQLARLARHMSACLDPDGVLHDAEERERCRELTVHQRPDGSSTVRGELTAEATELLLLHFDAFARPQPAVAGVKDPRTAAQRRHDALLQALKLNVRAQQLPKVAGVMATLVVTMTVEQYASGKGLASTAHGALIPAAQAFTWAAGDYRLFLAVLDSVRGVAAYSSTRRLFSENQRLALIARDLGCTFPNCPVPAPWCQVDHTINHADGGPTDVRFGVLACDYNNRVSKEQGWNSTVINGRAAWIPPPWIDPEQRPQYNDLHHVQPP